MTSEKIFKHSQLQKDNLLKLQNEFVKKKTTVSFNDAEIWDSKRWTKIFLNSIQNQHFLIFKDDFDLENLTTEDLEKFKSFAINWIIENIIFFNLLEQVDIYEDDYKIVKKLELTGFRKKLNSTLELFFIFKSKENNPQANQLITITFEIFSETKEKFVSYLNQELELKFLRYREINFNNEAYNITQWNKTRVDFFWKITYWVLCFKEIFDEIFKKINDEFATAITVSDNISFASWKATNDHKKMKLTFYYLRFDVELDINFGFTSYSDEHFNQKFSTNFEKTYVESSLKIAKTESIEFDYIYQIENENFFNWGPMDKYLHIYNFLNTLSQTIVNVWDFYLPALNLNARIRIYKYDLNYEKLIAKNFSHSGSFDIDLNFSTIQNNRFKRIIRIKW